MPLIGERSATMESWVLAVATVCLVTSVLIHLNLHAPFAFVALVLIAIGFVVSGHTGITSLFPVIHRDCGPLAAIPILIAFAITGAYLLNRSPALNWQFDADPNTWRPVVTQTIRVLGESVKVLTLSPPRTSRDEDSQLTAELGQIWPGSPKRIRLRAILRNPDNDDATGTSHGDFSSESQIEVVFAAYRTGQWVHLHSTGLDVGRWTEIILDIPADGQNIRAQATTGTQQGSVQKRSTILLNVVSVSPIRAVVIPKPLVLFVDFLALLLGGWIALGIAGAGIGHLRQGGFLSNRRTTVVSRRSFAAILMLCSGISLPILIFLLTDISPFGGDQSQYAQATIELYRAWQHGPTTWMALMAGGVSMKAPGLLWIGQAFVPIGQALGSINTGLLLSVLGAIVAVFILVFIALWQLTEGRLFIAVSGVLLVALAPMLLMMSHHYLVEPLQMLAVAWFLLIMSSAPSWNRITLLGNIIAASCLAVLAKASSPIYLLAPGILSLGFVFGLGDSHQRIHLKSQRTLIALVAVVPVFIGTMLWYWKNGSAVLMHVSAASSGQIAAMWGQSDTFYGSLMYWLSVVRDQLFTPVTRLIFLAVATAGILLWIVRPTRRLKYFTVCLVGGVVQIGLVLVVFSLNENRTVRYLLPLLPYFALVLGWAMAHIGSKALSILVAVVFGISWVISSIDYLKKADTSGSGEALLRAIVARTCADANGPRYSVIAADPAQMNNDWLGPVPAEYVAMRDQSGRPGSVSCRYGYLGDSFFGDTPANTWAKLVMQRPRYLVIPDPRVYPPAEKAFNQALNPHNYPVILGKLRSSIIFFEEPPIAQNPGILVFRLVDFIYDGRRLSDEGRHQEAIGYLLQATKQEPKNAEAWANLQLAYLRNRQYQLAIDTGQRALDLVPQHYYVLRNMAETFQIEGNWAESLNFGGRALRLAPGPQAKVDISVLLARSHLKLRQQSSACAVLRAARTESEDKMVDEEVQRAGC